MTWQPIRPDDGPAVYPPDVPYRVTTDSPDGQYVRGFQTWYGVFGFLWLLGPSYRLHVRLIEGVVEFAVCYTPTRNERAVYAGVREFAEDHANG